MGGEPTAAFLSLALPGDLPQSWVDRFLSGLLRLAKQFDVQLAGGDTAGSPGGVLADIIVVGRVPKGKAFLRSKARPGDAIYVTGELGSAAWTLHQLREGGLAALGRTARSRYRAHAAHFYPQPRVAVGRWLREHGVASAAIDISDGLSTDLGHICEESGVGALLYSAAVPHASAVDLTMLCTVGTITSCCSPRRPRDAVPSKIAGVRVSRIGEIIRGRKVWLVDSRGQRKPLPPARLGALRIRKNSEGAPPVPVVGKGGDFG